MPGRVLPDTQLVVPFLAVVIEAFYQPLAPFLINPDVREERAACVDAILFKRYAVQQFGRVDPGFLRQFRRSFVFVAIVTFIIELLSITPIIFMWNVFDRVVNSRSIVTLISLLVVVLKVLNIR